MDLSPDEDHFDGRLLHQAALWDNLELVQELLAAGAAVDARDAAGRSALHAAALAERSRCLGALLAAGAAPDASCNAQRTALHLASERGHADNVRALLAAGARLGLRDGRGDCALALAERAGHRHAAAVLRDARATVEHNSCPSPSPESSPVCCRLRPRPSLHPCLLRALRTTMRHFI